MALLDLLGRRWALRVLWELREGPLAFGELQRRCDGMSPSVLTTRLAELRETGLVETAPDGRHRATAQARALGELLRPLDAWAKRWARSLERGAR
jgi:DNA-binding HxlR family transcriptional regulator